jgi:hypothetical protein
MDKRVLIVDPHVFVQRVRTARDNINCHRKMSQKLAVTNECIKMKTERRERDEPSRDI